MASKTSSSFITVTIEGIVVMPMLLHALNRREPIMSSYLSVLGIGLTVTGCNKPTDLILSDNSITESRSTILRGFKLLNLICSILICSMFIYYFDCALL